MFFVEKVDVNGIDVWGVWREYDYAEKGEYDFLVDTRQSVIEAEKLCAKLNS